MDEVARGDTVLSLESRKPIFPIWSAGLSVELMYTNALASGAILASRASMRSRVRASIAILFCGPQEAAEWVG